MNPGEGLYLLSDVVRTSRPNSATLRNESGGQQRGGLRPLTALETISHDMAESVVSSALAENASLHYSTAFIGELMCVVYERQRLEREARAVMVIERWYASSLERRRRSTSEKIMHGIVQDALFHYAKEQEEFIAGGIVLKAMRAWQLHVTAKRTYQSLLRARDLRQLADAAMADRMAERHRHDAAVQIQKMVRALAARSAVAAKIIARQRQQRMLVFREAAEVIFSFLATNMAHRKFQRHVTERKRREKFEQDSRVALTVQRCLRWQLSHRFATVLFAHKFHRCSTQLQTWWRVVHSRRERARRIAAVEQEKKVERLAEAVVSLQSYVRMFLARSKFVVRRDFARSFPLLQRVGRAFLARSRGTFASNRKQEMAARSIQRFSCLVRSVRLLQQKRRLDRQAKALLHYEYAAQKIQRCWQMLKARQIAAENRRRTVLRDEAARLIQRNAVMWVAKCMLANLQRTQRDVAFTQHVERAAIRVQCNFRGWMARVNYASLVEERRHRMQLIHRVAQNYLFRKDLAMYYLRNRRARAAYRIQHAYRNHRDLLLADRRYRMRVSYVKGMRQKELAAVLIQRNVRCMFAVSKFQMLRRRRHFAATRIQTQVRMMLAKQVLDALIYDFRRELAARRVQMMWLATCHKFRQRRQINELETTLLEMDVTALFRSEANSRREVANQEDNVWSREKYRFDVILSKLATEYAARLEVWKAQNPAELQVEAATRIQAVLRGHLCRRSVIDSGDMRDVETTAMAESMLNAYDEKRGRDPFMPTHHHGSGPTVHSNTKVTAGTAVAQNLRLLSHGLMPSLMHEVAIRQRKVRSLHLACNPTPLRGGPREEEAEEVDSDPPPQSWFGWLSERPEICSRGFERLLQRESSARARVDQVYEVELALLRCQCAVPDNAHMRPIAALKARSASIDRCDDAPSTALVPISSSGTATPRRSVLLPPMLRPNSQSAMHASGVSSVVTNTYPQSTAELLRGALDDSKERLMCAAFRMVSVNAGGVDARGASVSGEHEATPYSQEGGAEDDAAPSDDGGCAPLEIDVSRACDLRSLNLSDTQLALILEKLRSNTVFTALFLDHNSLRDITCADIGSLMLHNETIATYSLANTEITDVGVTHLVSSIMRAPHVVGIDLRGTMVTEPYRRHLNNLANRNAARVRQNREREAADRKAKQQSSAPRSGFATLRSLPPPSHHNNSGSTAPARVARSAATSMKQYAATEFGSMPLATSPVSPAT